MSVFSLPEFFPSGWSTSLRETPALIGWKDATLVQYRHWAKDPSGPHVGEEPKAQHLWVCLQRPLLPFSSIGWASSRSHWVAPLSLARRGVEAGLSGFPPSCQLPREALWARLTGTRCGPPLRKFGELGSLEGLEGSRGTLHISRDKSSFLNVKKCIKPYYPLGFTVSNLCLRRTLNFILQEVGISLWKSLHIFVSPHLSC